MVFFAFALTLFAGLSTGIGSAIALFARRTNTTFLTVALGFSTGVMLYVSFVELLAGAFDTLGGFVARSAACTPYWLSLEALC